ncbi:exonuclease recombination-associated [Vibrio phage PWH3a-P1]|uniref:exonuclease recombination-associated n=1 Tax=Vibrio phage PWH3a-P1 TaxID=754058 RepID=UPI0002C124BE|nr:exonuclease recombination-associated [Vibrio phage PWH3a-P1]AGH31981.1 recombination associated protein [Vibrio phage PWH3a-P1]
MKSNVIYQTTKDRDFTAKEAIKSDYVEAYKFSPCGELDKRKLGFVPNIIDGEYVSEVNVEGNSFTAVTVRIQTKSPEKYLIDQLINEKRVIYMVDSDFKEPEKSLVKEWREEATNQIMKATLPKEPKDYVVAFRNDGVVFVETPSSKIAEDVLALIRKAIGSLPVVPVETDKPVTDLMDNMVQEKESSEFTLGNKAKLEDDEGIAHALSKGSLYASDAPSYVKEGMFVKELELVYDGVTTFTLKDDVSLGGIKFDKGMFEEDSTDAGSFLIKLDEVNKVVNKLLSRLSD